MEWALDVLEDEWRATRSESRRHQDKHVSLCFDSEHVRAVFPTQVPTLAFSLLPVPMTSLYKQAYSAFLSEKPRVSFLFIVRAYLVVDIVPFRSLPQRSGLRSSHRAVMKERLMTGEIFMCRCSPRSHRNRGSIPEIVESIDIQATG